MRPSKAEEHLANQLKACGIEFRREYRFHPVRRWRADFFIPPVILVEVEGVSYARGQRATRHQFGRGYEEDCIKYNAAAKRGFVVLRFTPDLVFGKGRGNRTKFEPPAIATIIEHLEILE